SIARPEPDVVTHAAEMHRKRGPPAACPQNPDGLRHQARTPKRRSVPPIRRERLVRCLKIISAAAAMATASVAADAPVAYAIDGSAREARIDPSEMYLLAHTATRKTSSEGGTAIGVSTEKTPQAVATPFPPLNFSQTGYTWPMIAAKPAAA